LPHIFEPFQRGDGGSRHSGAGLGLAIVQGFVESNGGSVSVKSRRGEGTVFAVELPATAPGRRAS
jgi:signal transduction histidine kinase